MEKTITLEQAALRLGKSKRTIYDYVDKNILTPITHRSLSGGIVFHEKDIVALQEKWNSRLVINAAASLLNVPVPFLHKWVEENNVKVEVESAGTKIRKYITQEDLSKYEDNIQANYKAIKGKKRKPIGVGRELTLYHNQLRLFDSVVVDGQSGVIIDVDPPTILISGGSIIAAETLKWESKPCKDLPYSAYQGHCTFKFSGIQSYNCPEIHVLGKLVYHFGTQNIRVFEDEGVYTVYCRNGLVEAQDLSLSELKPYLVEGELWSDSDFLVVGDIEKRINIGIKYSWIPQIEEKAKEHNLSIQKWISEKVGEWIIK